MRWLAGLLLLAGALGAACSGESSMEVFVTGDAFDPVLRAALEDAAVTPLSPPPPEDPALVQLGEKLFFDKLLSGNRNISCASCHRPEAFTGDGLPLALGEGAVGTAPDRELGDGRIFSRHSMPLFNVGLPQQTVIFHDNRVQRDPETGRLTMPPPTDILNEAIEDPPQSPEALLARELTSALAAQATLPVLSRIEMRGQDDGSNPDNELAPVPNDDPMEVWHRIMVRLMALEEDDVPEGLQTYRAMFEAAFPDVSPGGGPFEETFGFHFGHAARAMAAFQREAFTTLDSPFDRYVRGDPTALTEQQKRGGIMFFGRTRKAQCANCHRGPLLSDFETHAIGVPQIGPGVGGSGDDLGDGSYRFRTPALRNVELTGPYFHDGAFQTLREAVVFYDDIERSLLEYDASRLPPAFQSVDIETSQNPARLAAAEATALLPMELGLTEREVDDLVAFLESLTDPRARTLPTGPVEVPSGLPVSDDP